MPSSEPAACTNQLQCSTSPLKSSAANRPRTGVLDSHPAENNVTAQEDVLDLLRRMLGSLQSRTQDHIDMTVAVSNARMCIAVCLSGGEVVNEGGVNAGVKGNQCAGVKGSQWQPWRRGPIGPLLHGCGW